MDPTPQPNPTPQPTNPNPGALPIEVDPGGLHSMPEVDYGNEPVPPVEPQPDVVPEPEKEEPGPETNPL
jgi:hypothetical protein